MISMEDRPQTMLLFYIQWRVKSIWQWCNYKTLAQYGRYGPKVIWGTPSSKDVHVLGTQRLMTLHKKLGNAW